MREHAHGFLKIFCDKTFEVTFFSCLILCVQMGADTLGAPRPVLAGLGGHVGWSHCDHRPGPSLQAHPRHELVE